MFFAILVFISSLSLEVLGTYISVVGLASTSYVLVYIVISLDLAKIVIATTLYKYGKEIPSWWKIYLIPTLLFLMFVTSYFSYGFLTGEFNKGTSSQAQTQVKIEGMNTEKLRLDSRKKEIDQQISQLPPDQVTQRRRLTELFADEIGQINTRIVELDREIPAAKLKLVEGESHMGIVGNIAKSWDITTTKATQIISLLVVLVIDPLAIALLTIGNFLFEKRKKEKIEEAHKKSQAEALQHSLDNGSLPSAPDLQQTIAPIEKYERSSHKNNINENSQTLTNQAIIHESNTDDLFSNKNLKTTDSDLVSEVKNDINESKVENIPAHKNKLNVAPIVSNMQKSLSIEKNETSNLDDDVFDGYKLTEADVENFVGKQSALNGNLAPNKNNNTE